MGDWHRLGKSDWCDSNPARYAPLSDTPEELQRRKKCARSSHGTHQCRHQSCKVQDRRCLPGSSPSKMPHIRYYLMINAGLTEKPHATAGSDLHIPIATEYRRTSEELRDIFSSRANPRPSAGRHGKNHNLIRSTWFVSVHHVRVGVS